MYTMTKLKKKLETDAEYDELRPVSEVKKESVITDMASDFLGGVQGNVDVAAGNIKKFWDFINEWSKEVVRNDKTKTIYKISEKVRIELE